MYSDFISVFERVPKFEGTPPGTIDTCLHKLSTNDDGVRAIASYQQYVVILLRLVRQLVSQPLTLESKSTSRTNALLQTWVDKRPDRTVLQV